VADPGAVELDAREVRTLTTWLYQLAGFIEASGEINEPHAKRLIALADDLKDRAESLPCHTPAPFEVTEPARTTYRPLCTAKGHKYGHSTTVAPGAMIHWRDAEPKP
jgi:hypothetical protein